jgi:hypothetical protein
MEYIDTKINLGMKPTKFILYRIDNLLLHRYYIGISYSPIHPKDRKYESSSCNPEFWEDLKDHPEHFRFTILEYFNNLKSLRYKENLLTSRELRLRDNMYNMIQAPVNSPDLNDIIKDLHESLDIYKSPIFKRIRTRSNKLELAKLNGELYYSIIGSKTRKSNNKELKDKGLPYPNMNFNDRLTKVHRIKSIETRLSKYNLDKERGNITQYDKTWIKRRESIYKDEWNTLVYLTNGIDIIFTGSIYDLTNYMYGSISHVKRVLSKLDNNKPYRSGSKWKGYRVILKEHATTISKESTLK